MSAPSIRVRTGFSFRHAVGQVEEVVSRLKEVGVTVAPITDRASAFGWRRFRDECAKQGLRPVFGVELDVSPEPAASKPIYDTFTFLARDTVAPVNRLIHKATSQFRYTPLLSMKQALAHPDVFAVAGNRANLDLVAEHLVHPEMFRVALSPAVSPGYVRRVRERGYRWVSAGCNLHPRADDLTLQQVVCSQNPAMRTYPTHILSAGEWRAAMAGKGLTEAELDGALAETAAVLDACRAELPKGEMLRPERPGTLREMCEAGARKLGCDLADPVYAARLTEELGVIEGKGFEDYFYILADLQSYARSVMTCGPARGSSAGSLVCYLLGITTVDPIPHGLLFSRFLDATRTDWPDCDLDYNHVKRDLLFAHAARRYGADHVARLGAVAMYKADNTAKAVAGALGLAPWALDGVKAAKTKHAAGSEEGKHALREALRETDAGKLLMRQHPEVAIAERMENHPSHMGQHAAGIILTQRPVADYVAVDARTGATHCDKYDAEKLDLLKIDALGLTQLGIFEDALRDAGLPHDHLDALTFDDPAVFAVFNARRFSGIFQFTGGALQGLARQVNFKNFDDIVALTSLARPGPMGSGGAAKWIARNTGKEAVSYAHPAFEPFLKDTLGVVVYQETVMALAREIGGMEWGDVNAMRKAMGKSLGRSAMEKFGDKFKAGALAKGIPADVVARVWDELVENGGYLFNKSHAVAYAMISYWCAWLKTYHPGHFAAATLQHQSDADKQIVTLRELVMEGMDYVPVSAKHSTDRWRVAFVDGREKLIGPVQTVQGIGPKMVAAIVGARARGEPIPERAAKLLANPVTKLDSLFPIRDAFFRLLPDPAAANILTPRTPVSECLSDLEERTVVLFVRIDAMKLVDENEASRVERRGRRIEGPHTTALNLHLADDTGAIFSKIHCRDYDRIGKAVLARGGAGKALYAVKGTVRGDDEFKMVWVQQMRYIGQM